MRPDLLTFLEVVERTCESMESMVRQHRTLVGWLGAIVAGAVVTIAWPYLGARVPEGHPDLTPHCSPVRGGHAGDSVSGRSGGRNDRKAGGSKRLEKVTHGRQKQARSGETRKTRRRASASPHPSQASPSPGPVPVGLPEAAAALVEAGVIFVDVAGAVRRPGVYRLRVGARAFEAVALAGGPTRTADLPRVNLASYLVDEEMLVVPDTPSVVDPAQPGASTPSPGRGVRTHVTSSGTRFGTPPAPLPTPHTPALGFPVSMEGASIRVTKEQPATLAAHPVSLNAASVIELESVPHIGPSLAEAIVTWREQHGPFVSLDDLRRVPRLGPRTFSRIAPYVTP